MGGPTLEDVTSNECPPDKPYKCLPYGTCFGHEEYCDAAANDVHSCFPSDLKDNESLLDWCHKFLKGEMQALHPSCQLACHRRFNGTFGGYITPPQESFTSHSSDVHIAVWLVLAVSLIANMMFLLHKFCLQKKSGKCCTNNWRMKAFPPEEPPSPADDDGANDPVNRRDSRLPPNQARYTAGNTATLMQPVGAAPDHQPLLPNPNPIVTLRLSDSDHPEQGDQEDDRSSTSTIPAASGHSGSSSNNSSPQTGRRSSRHRSRPNPPRPGTNSTREEQNRPGVHRNGNTPQTPHDQFLRAIHVGQTHPDSHGNHQVVASGAPYTHTLD